MNRALTGYAFHACIAQRRQVQALEQGFATSQQHRAHREMKFVEQPCLQILAHRGHAAAHAHIQPGCRCAACSSAAWMPSVTKWNVVPPAMVSGLRACWVSTKTGT